MQGRRSLLQNGQSHKNGIKDDSIKHLAKCDQQNQSGEGKQSISQSRSRSDRKDHKLNQKSRKGIYNFRKIIRKNYNDLFSDSCPPDDEDQDFQFQSIFKHKHGSKKRGSNIKQKRKISEQLNSNEIVEYDRLPNRKSQLTTLVKETEDAIKEIRSDWFSEQFELPTRPSNISIQSIPIFADVRTFDFKKLIKEQLKLTGKVFDAIMMDPPWQLSSSQPSRGVAIGYESLSDDFILQLPIPQLQKQGFIFIWAINAKYKTAARCIKQWGYKLVDEIVWVKKTVNGKLAKSHGYYLQHAKENCLVGVKVSNQVSYNIRVIISQSVMTNQQAVISFGVYGEDKAKNQRINTSGILLGIIWKEKQFETSMGHNWK